ncbi:serine protease inhibitor I/II-like [Athalia rosae]|uniref:serine protease inhibitor I/II-like n=1 Tax=Athalia rosae TaxID=37344 RepID=UPI0020338878|nr:serine protease inhibitor I/II-like [Athalia rosae]
MIKMQKTILICIFIMVLLCTWIVAGTKKYPVCCPGESWKDDCNTCWCNEFGNDSMCTLMACAE